jgi:hypothetical protein
LGNKKAKINDCTIKECNESSCELQGPPKAKEQKIWLEIDICEIKGRILSHNKAWDIYHSVYILKGSMENPFYEKSFINSN